MSDTYILEGTQPVPCADLLTWGRWFEAADRQVVETWVTPEIRVSTMMVFWEGGSLDQEQERYATWAEAEAGHAAMVARVLVALAAWPPAPPGSLCEVCLDAPAVALAPAPWGGERGVCAACATGTPVPPP